MIHSISSVSDVSSVKSYREECPICLMELYPSSSESERDDPDIDPGSRELVTVLRCNHAFHNYCINQWFKKKNTCPCCRTIEFQSDIKCLVWHKSWWCFGSWRRVRLSTDISSLTYTYTAAPNRVVTHKYNYVRRINYKPSKNYVVIFHGQGNDMKITYMKTNNSEDLYDVFKDRFLAYQRLRSMNSTPNVSLL